MDDLSVRRISKLSAAFDNIHYYTGDQGHSIMDSRNFSPEIDLYLNAELAACASLMARYNYRYLIEFGCGMLRMLGASMVNDAKYLGVDVREEIKPWSRSFISDNGLRLCRFVRAKAERFVDLSNRLIIKKNVSEVSRKGLIVLPFNFIGNVHNLLTFIESITAAKADIFISQFSTNEQATYIRSNYYVNCGLDLIYENNQFGCVFRGENFSSYTYHSAYIDSLMVAHGYPLVDKNISNIYHICHYRPVATNGSIFAQSHIL